MKLALIPPVAQLYDTFYTNMQLALPHMFYQSKTYSDTYKHHLEGVQGNYSHVILDNGAAEDAQPNNEDLCELIVNLIPTEFALPDVLKDSDATVAQAFHFLLDHGKDIPPSVKAGFVAQGRSCEEARDAIDAIIDSSVGERIKVIYIPRLLVKESGNLTVRLDLAEYVHNRYPELEIHLFGSAPAYPQEAADASNFPFIRSIDTSMPYVLAYHGIELNSQTLQVPARPDDYFNLVLSPWQEKLAVQNVATLLEWTNNGRN